MAGFVNLKVSGQQKFLRDISGVSKKLKDKRGVHLAAVIAYERWVKKNFQAQGKNHNDPKYRWKPLSESTLVRRRRGKGKGGAKILQDTGSLRLRWSRTATNAYGKLRSAVTYSAHHEEGGRRGNPPQRKIFPSDTQGRGITRPVFEKFVEKATK